MSTREKKPPTTTQEIPEWLEPGVYVRIDNQRARVLEVDPQRGVACLSLTCERIGSSIVLSPSAFTLDPDQSPVVHNQAPRGAGEKPNVKRSRTTTTKGKSIPGWLERGLCARINCPRVQNLHGQRVQVLERCGSTQVACRVLEGERAGDPIIVSHWHLVPDHASLPHLGPALASIANEIGMDVRVLRKLRNDLLAHSPEPISLHKQILTMASKQRELHVDALRIEMQLFHESWHASVKAAHNDACGTGSGDSPERALENLAENLREKEAAK